jgi:hypothetical protein
MKRRTIEDTKDILQGDMKNDPDHVSPSDLDKKCSSKRAKSIKLEADAEEEGHTTVKKKQKKYKSQPAKPIKTEDDDEGDEKSVLTEHEDDEMPEPLWFREIRDIRKSVDGWSVTVNDGFVLLGWTDRNEGVYFTFIPNRRMVDEIPLDELLLRTQACDDVNFSVLAKKELWFIDMHAKANPSEMSKLYEYCKLQDFHRKVLPEMWGGPLGKFSVRQWSPSPVKTIEAYLQLIREHQSRRQAKKNEA